MSLEQKDEEKARNTNDKAVTRAYGLDDQSQCLFMSFP